MEHVSSPWHRNSSRNFADSPCVLFSGQVVKTLPARDWGVDMYSERGTVTFVRTN